jgi:5-methylcytosine-specific restriction protein A
MSRREFSRQTKRDAFLRANGSCEVCGARLSIGKFDYDHIIPDALGGEPTLDNCRVACKPCHSAKTGKQDIPAIAKTKRIRDRERGIRRPSRGFYDSKKFKMRIGGGLVDRRTGQPAKFNRGVRNDGHTDRT